MDQKKYIKRSRIWRNFDEILQPNLIDEAAYRECIENFQKGAIENSNIIKSEQTWI